jgi:hypothetical protein
MTPSSERDYLDEVAEEVAKYLDGHDHVISAEAASELIARWEAENPGLLIGWLRVRAQQVLKDYIYTVTLSRGARRRGEEQRGRFAKFADGFHDALNEGAEKGREFYRYHSVTEGALLIRKPLGDLTAKQVQEVRDRYHQAARDSGFYARVYEKVRLRVVAKGSEAVVADVYTPEQLENMFKRGDRSPLVAEDLRAASDRQQSSTGAGEAGPPAVGAGEAGPPQQDAVAEVRFQPGV